MSGDVSLYEADGLVIHSLEDIADRGFTEGEARKLIDGVKQQAAYLELLVVAAYVGRAHEALGYPTWATFCQGEGITLHTRLSVEERAALHYRLARQYRLPTGAINAFSGAAPSTILLDVKKHAAALEAHGEPVLPVPDVVLDTAGRRRFIGGQARSLASVEADGEMVDADVVDVEVLSPAAEPQVAVSVEDLPASVAPAEPSKAQRERAWVDQFDGITRALDRVMQDAAQVMGSPNLRRNLARVPEGDIERWGDWAEQMLEWAGKLAPPDEG